MASTSHWPCISLHVGRSCMKLEGEVEHTILEVQPLSKVTARVELGRERVYPYTL